MDESEKRVKQNHLRGFKIAQKSRRFAARRQKWKKGEKKNRLRGFKIAKKVAASRLVDESEKKGEKFAYGGSK